MIKSLEINLSLNPFHNQIFSHLSKTEILSIDEMKSLITQANDLGANKIVLYDDPEKSYFNIIEIEKHIEQLGITSKILPIESLISFTKDSDNIQCFKHKFSCFVNLHGNIFPCKGLPLLIGNLHNDTLKKILTDSEVMENLKNHIEMIKGPCRRCKKFSNCYGCRGRAFKLTGDYLASDPGCSENRNYLEQITYLPMNVKIIIPQKNGMRVVSTLLNVEERYAKVESVFSNKSPFVKKDGSLEEITYMEIMAQSAAVMNGFSKYDTGAPFPGGFLLGGQKINIYKKSFINEKLVTDIYKTAKFGNFGILTATVKRGNEIIADGEIKIFQNDGEKNEI
jgi:radical SAM protein with 4Fe4S-binding SPASM domain